MRAVTRLYDWAMTRLSCCGCGCGVVVGLVAITGTTGGLLTWHFV